MSGIKAAWMQEQSSSWDEEYEKLFDVYRAHPEEVLFVAGNLDVLHDMTSVGWRHPQLANHIYEVPSPDILNLMTWVSTFVGHDMFDNGNPQVIWVTLPRSASPDMIIGKDGPRATPLLVRDFDEVDGVFPIYDLDPLREAVSHCVAEMAVNYRMAEKLRIEKPMQEVNPQRRRDSKLIEAQIMLFTVLEEFDARMNSLRDEADKVTKGLEVPCVSTNV
jgi:hypothetical protein